jgi:hypothetical protein
LIGNAKLKRGVGLVQENHVTKADENHEQHGKPVDMNEQHGRLNEGRADCYSQIKIPAQAEAGKITHEKSCYQ